MLCSCCWTVSWISYRYTYIPSFLGFLPVQGPPEHCVEFSVLYARFSLVAYVIYSINRECIYVNSNLPVRSITPLSPHGVHICSLCLCLYFGFAETCTIFPELYTEQCTKTKPLSHAGTEEVLAEASLNKPVTPRSFWMEFTAMLLVFCDPLHFPLLAFFHFHKAFMMVFEGFFWWILLVLIVTLLEKLTFNWNRGLGDSG